VMQVETCTDISSQRSSRAIKSFGKLIAIPCTLNCTIPSVNYFKEGHVS